MKTKNEIIELCVEAVGLWRTPHDAKLYRKKIRPWIESKLKEQPEKNKPSGLGVSFWVMTDIHTFIKLDGSTLKKIREKAINICKENPWGMLCRPIILQDGKEIARVGENAHIDKDGKVDIKTWFKSVKNDKNIKSIFKKRDSMEEQDEKMVSIPIWKMKQIEDTLRLANNIHHSQNKETCFDRQVCKSWDFAKESLQLK